METESDLFACCKHIFKMVGFFGMFDFCICVLASVAALLPRIEISSFVPNI